MTKKRRNSGQVQWLTPVIPALSEAEVGRSLEDRKSTRLNSSHLVISYAVFCLKKKTKRDIRIYIKLLAVRSKLLNLSESLCLGAIEGVVCCVYSRTRCNFERRVRAWPSLLMCW